MATLDFKLLVSGLLKRNKGVSTEREYWNFVVWSFAALLLGEFPATDWLGGDWAENTDADLRSGAMIAGGLFAVIWNIKGDMDWLANTLHLAHASGRMMCPWCSANTCQDCINMYDAMDIAHSAR